MKNLAKVRSRKNGFTLVEMLVVLGIFLVLTMLLLTKASQFNSQSLLEGITYDVALSVREAQNYGVSVREAPGNTEDFSSSYQVYFNESSPTNYTLSSVNQSGATLVKNFTLPNGYFISRICGASGGSDCTNSNTCYATITFTRPSPDAATMLTCVSGGGGVGIGIGLGGQDLLVQVSSVHGTTRDIIIRTSGQISVQ